MLDYALDILYDKVKEIRAEQIYYAQIAGRDEKELKPFRRRFTKGEPQKSKGGYSYDIVVESPTKAKQREEELSEVRRELRRERIFSLQGRIYELQGAIDIIKSLEDAGPDDAIEYEVGTVVDERGMPVRVEYKEEDSDEQFCKFRD